MNISTKDTHIVFEVECNEIDEKNGDCRELRRGSDYRS
jgi:hypothetical protein